jgi:hypothetical protein
MTSSKGVKHDEVDVKPGLGGDILALCTENLDVSLSPPGAFRQSRSLSAVGLLAADKLTESNMFE